MALIGGSRRDVLRALALGPGSGRLIALRWGLVVASSLPALVVARARLTGGPAIEPYYTGVDGKLPLAHLMRFMSGMPIAFAMALAAAALAVLADQFLTAGAVPVLTGRTPRVWASVTRDARRRFWPLLRLVLMGSIAMGLGAAIIHRFGDALRHRGLREGWPGMVQQLWVPLTVFALTLVWMAAAGAWTLWARALAVLDARRCARRTGWLALRALWRHPVSGLATYVVVTLAALLGTGALLAAWFAAEPATAAGVGMWALLWLAALAAQSYVWHWMVRAACMLQVAPRLQDLRCAPDEPFRILRRAWGWAARAVGRGRRQSATPPPESR